MKKEKVLSYEEAVRELQEKVRIQANRPNVLGYKPHDKQRLFHSSQRRNRLYIGGNRSGKTTGGIVEDIKYMAGTQEYRSIWEPPIRGRIIGVDFTDGIEKILLPEFRRWCPPSYLRGGSWFSAYATQERTVYFENGSFAEFMSYEQDVEKFAGTSRHFVHFDEEPPQDIYIENIARLIDTEGHWWMTLTPVLGMEWMYDEIYIPGTTNPDAVIDVIEVDMAENPYLGVAAIQSFLDALPEEDRAARMHGQFVRRGGVIYKPFKANVHVIKPLDGVPEGWLVYASMDHGFNNPTAWLWHCVSPDGDVITFAEHYEREMTISEHAEVVKAMNKAIGIEPMMMVCDPACAQRNPLTGTSIISEYQVAGVNLAPGINDVMVGINKVNSYMSFSDERKPRWHVTSNCTSLIKELPKYRWKTWANKKSERTNNPYDIPHKKDDHACDSLRYFFTIMPDLAPVKETKREDTFQLLPAVGINMQQPVFDKNLQKTSKWNIEYAGPYVDEYIGGQW